MARIIDHSQKGWDGEAGTAVSSETDCLESRLATHRGLQQSRVGRAIAVIAAGERGVAVAGSE